ncbi:MAG: phosphotransferase [Planctomycetales bacterium]|nr:phosphotransferase [Planctomycetales bacterium]
MRISLLRQREDFNAISAATIAHFCKTYFGGDYHVTWNSPPSHERSAARGTTWRCNEYLNIIFPSSPDPRNFDPIRREFTQSPIAWRRPLQHVYVALALAPLSSRLLAHASLHIQPALPDENHWIIVPGNNRIRLLNAARQQTFVVKKSGFPDSSLDAELEVRQSSAASGIRIPKLLEVHSQDHWFSEQFVSATPINRLSDRRIAVNCATDALSQLRTLIDSTHADVAATDYLDGLVAAVGQGMERIACLDSPTKQRVLRVVDGLVRGVNWPATVPTALTHGDFQPANLLANDAGVWTIDWEFAGRRYAPYDLLVFQLESRRPRGLFDRLQTWLSRPPALPDGSSIDWPGLPDGSAAAEWVCGNLYLLEELRAQLDQLVDRPIRCPGVGFRTVLNEVEMWLRSKSD